MLFKRYRSMEGKPEIIQIWSPVICFARCYGIVPLKKCDQEPYFERCPGSFCWCLTVASVYLFTLTVAILVFKDTFSLPSTVIADASHHIIYYSHCELTILFFLFRSGDLVRLLQKWIETERLFDRSKIRLGKVTTTQCWFIYIATIIMSTVENTVYIVSAVFKGNISDSGEILVKLAGQGTNLEPYFGKYKYIYAIFLVLVESVSEVAWITGDFIIALISILLRRYYEVLHQQLLRSHERSNSPRQLEELRQAQLAISTLAQKVAEVFSPLILIAVGFDVTFILAFLYSGLEEDLSSPSILVRFIFTFSFIYLVLRLAFSAYLASRLTEMPGKIVDYLYSLPSLVGYNVDQQRSRLIKMDLVIQQIQSEPIALSGGGFFVFSKASAATLFSLIVTYEVVMLQLPR